MQEINLKIWWNDGTGDWTLEINGLRHEHVSAEALEELVECALIVAEKSLTEAANRRPQ